MISFWCIVAFSNMYTCGDVSTEEDDKERKVHIWKQDEVCLQMQLNPNVIVL